MKKKLIFYCLFIFILTFVIPKNIASVDCTMDAINAAGNDQGKLTDVENACLNASKQANNDLYSYQSQLQLVQSKRNLTLVQIAETKQKIETTQKELDIIASRIEGLDSSLNTLSALLIQKVVKSYKQRSISLFSLVLDAQSASELLNQIEYVKTVRNDNQKLLVQVQEAKTNFQEQEKLREEKKAELDALSTSLAQLNINLEKQQETLDQLLAVKQSEINSINNILATAQAQLAGFRSFVASSGLGIISADPSWPSDYYSQRDSRWANQTIGNSSENILSVGCLLTSVAMVAKHYGENTTPSTIAADTSRFYSYTAYMNLPWKSVAGRSCHSLSCNGENINIDQELRNNNYVVVGVNNCSNGGSHFVVLISGSNGNYIMNDPLYGPNLSFSSHYSNICSAATFR